MHRLRLLAIPLAGTLILTLFIFTRMGNVQAASPTASSSSCGNWVVIASPNPGASDVLDGIAAVN